MAAYRYITLATETVAWTGSSGTEMKVEIALRREESDYFGNGEWKPTSNALAVTTTTHIGGKVDQSSDWLRSVEGRTDGIVASIGKVGIRAPQLALIKAAYAAINARPELVALRAAKAAGDVAERDYQAHAKAVDDMMTLNGRTY